MRWNDNDKPARSEELVCASRPRRRVIFVIHENPLERKTTRPLDHQIILACIVAEVAPRKILEKVGALFGVAQVLSNFLCLVFRCSH